MASDDPGRPRGRRNRRRRRHRDRGDPPAALRRLVTAEGQGRPWENLPETAAREILEETGYSPTLGWLLGHVHYPVQKKTKVVYYWTAEVTEGDFVANDEVDVLEWVTRGGVAAGELRRRP